MTTRLNLSMSPRLRFAHSSGRLVSEVFRLVDGNPPDWLLLEDVQFMLRLDRGAAMEYLTGELETRGFTWAYRVVDSRAFGLPQRRKRVVVLASRTHDPRPVLFADDAGEQDEPDASTVGCGFYWTEGIRGLGWGVDCLPTLKGGSTIGIPSPPAIRLPDSEGIVVPEIRDAERLQGFDADWTLAAAADGRRKGVRWKLVGNAVSVPMAAWVGGRGRDEHCLDAFVAALIAFEKLIPSRRAATYGTAGVLLALGVLVMVAPDAVPAFTIPGTGSMSDMSPMAP